MQNDKQSPLEKSLTESFQALCSVIHSLYELAPLVVIVGAGLLALVVWLVIQWQPMIIASTILLVLVISVGIFAARGSFGEAMLSLVGGLLTTFSVEWTISRFVAFSVAWAAFVFAALLISSVKIAARSEDIFRQAGIRFVGAGALLKQTEKRLKEIASSSDLGMLGPIERAELVRLFAYRGVPVDLLLPCLRGVETLGVITKCDIKTVAIFVADFLMCFRPIEASDAQSKVDSLYRTIRDCPVPPGEFFEAFEKSRRLLVSGEMLPEEFLNTLAKCLKAGFDAGEVAGEMRRIYKSPT